LVVAMTVGRVVVTLVVSVGLTGAALTLWTVSPSPNPTSSTSSEHWNGHGAWSVMTAPRRTHTCHPGDPLAGVHDPGRLGVTKPCQTITGKVCQLEFSEGDGDKAFDVIVDPQYRKLLKSTNVNQCAAVDSRLALHLETIPQSDAGSAFKSPVAQTLALKVGYRVSVTGPLVQDNWHGGWTEIHPVEFVDVKASCTVLTGNAKKTTDKLSGCTPAADTGGTAIGVSKAGKGTSGTAVLTWANRHGKTSISYNYARVTPPKCGTSVVNHKKTNNIERTLKGSVTASSGTASKDIKVGDPISATVCVNAATRAESLLAGTKFVL
jgi:hypothetical protein